MSISNYLENALINAILRNTAYTSVETVYLALYTTDPTDTDTGAEVSGGSYARQSITFASPTDGVTANNSDITFPVATNVWGTITHFGIKDAATEGNLLFYGAIAPTKTINVGEQLKILTGELEVILT